MIDTFTAGVSWLWKKSPALLLGLQLLLGIGFAASGDISILIAEALLLIPFLLHTPRMYRQAVIGFMTCLIGFTHGSLSLPPKEDFSPALEGWALFSPSNIKLQKNLFHSSYVYKGEIKYFASNEGKVFYDLPCTLYAPQDSERPLADTSFFLKGTLQKIDSRGADLQVDGPWQKVEGTFSLAETRHKAKKTFSQFVKKQLPDKRVSDFLYALCTGEVEDRMMSYEFSKLGLQHILAVSGFHFALIALFIGFIINRLLPEKIALVFLIIMLSLYFFFLGSSPSVFRAWIAITVWAMGRILSKKSLGLNTLGVCLLIELLYNPSCIYHLGFQLSFLCTGAILLCTPIAMKWMCYIFPKRSAEEIKELSSVEKGAYLACSFFRSTIAVTLAVHIASVPVCLYYFHIFPLLSLIYNLFFPLLTGLSLFSFMAAALLSFIIPPLAVILNGWNVIFTSFLMDLSAHPPVLLHYSLRVESLPLWIIVIYLITLLHLFSISLTKQKNV